MAAIDESSSNLFMIDEAYEFTAPRFYDFICGETDEDVRTAELWFENNRPYAPSPFMPKIKATRTVQTQILCNFGEDEQKAPESSEAEPPTEPFNQTKPQAELITAETTEEVKTTFDMNTIALNKNSEIEKTVDDDAQTKCPSLPTEEAVLQGAEVCCTPAPPKQTTENNKVQTAKKIASILKNPSSINSKKNQLQKSQAKSTKPASVSRRRDGNVTNVVGTPNFAHENHALKRQKLDGGKSRQILTITKPSNLPHKTRTGIVNSNSNLCASSTTKTSKEDRKMYVREAPAPFVSMAEMMGKFQSGTRQMSLSRNSSLSQSNASGTMQQNRKPKLKLTRPKTPEFETSQRVRSVKIKSSAELEEEMMAKIPKFKARPLNKKIFEGPALPPLPRSTPHPPEFKEFHLETMSRANHNAETSSMASTESTEARHQWKPHLTAPKSPLLQTLLRARPPRIKSSEELEKEQLENVPQFKARPLNRKIFESKGDMGIFSNMKRQVTIPEEFHFAIDKRIPPPPPPRAVVDLFDKLSISSESLQEKPLPRNTTPNPFHLHTDERGAEKEKRLAEELMQKQLEEERARVPKAHPYPYTTDYPVEKPLPRNTTPNPFHLHTDERGAEKEKRLAEELMQKQLEEERARVPKAHPYPYTTDYPVIPPKPEPKPCTKPEPFQLESLLRHEEEIQREMEEKKRMEMEEAQMRIFKAQPILKEDPIPVPEKERKPLTEVQEFNLHVDHRAVDRAEFDKKIKEKEITYKRYRYEAESARMMEDEKALKQLRRTLVPHARPLPKFDNPFLPQRSAKGVTKAKSPKLHVDKRKEKRRIVCSAASSAAAFNMR